MTGADHPDDLAARLGLRSMLIARRERLGWSQRDLAKVIGRSGATVGWHERYDSWLITSVQRLSGGLGGRLLLHPAGEPPEYPTRPDGTAGWAWDRRNLVAELRSLRTRAGLRQRDIGERMGVSESQVQHYERGTDMRLCTAQRYCRAAGSWLWIGVQW